MKRIKNKKIYLNKSIVSLVIIVIVLSLFLPALPAQATTRNATYNYNAFQFYNDDGSTINNATAYNSVAENANVTDVMTSSTIRLRIAINQTLVNANANFAFTPQIQFKAGATNCTDATGWTTVPVQASCGTNAICQWTSANFADGALTTQRLTGTFRSGGDGIETGGTANQVTYTSSNDQAEWEWMLAVTPNAAISTTYTIRPVYSGGTVLNAYGRCSTLTTWDGPPELSQSAYRWFENSDTFGTGGVVTGASDSNTPRAMAKDSTYMYLVGQDDNTDWRIEKRLLSTGILDSNFGTAGVVTGASASNSAYDIAIDSTYMYVAGTDSSLDFRIEKRLLSTGTLDSNFGTAGVLIGPSDSHSAYAIAIDSTYMYVAGRNQLLAFRIEKYLLSDGSPDINFGTAGAVVGGGNEPRSIAIDSTYMYVSGYNNDLNFYIEKRLLTTGVVDSNFGTAGVVIGTSASRDGSAIAIDSTYMYIAGYNSNTDWHIEKRLLSTGTLDSNFGTAGVVTGASASQTISSIVIDSTYMYVAGFDSSTNWRIEKRLLSTGDLVSNFGTSGVVNGASASQYSRDVIIDSTYMYVTGTDDNSDLRIEKRTLLDGSLATSAAVGRPLAPQDTLATLAHASSTFRLRMNMHVTGSDMSAGAYAFKLQVAAKGASATCGAVSVGSFSDVSTSAGAIRYYDNTGTDNAVRLIASPYDPLHSDHTVVNQTYQEQNNFTSTSTVSAGQDAKWDFSLIDFSATRGTTYCFRATTTDAIVINYASSTFPEITTGPTLTQAGYRWLEDNQGKVFGDNGSGVVTGDSNSHTSYVIAIDSTYMYVGGRKSGLIAFRIEKRLLSDGSLDSNFGTAGAVVGGGNEPRSIAIDSTYMYVAGYNSNINSYIEKRLLSTGALDSNFGTAGVVTGASTSYDVGSIAIDSTYMYIASNNTDANWRIEKRLLSTGALDSGFGTSGVVNGPTISGNTFAIAIDSTYMYVAGMDDNIDLRIEKRLLSTGALDSGFGTSGVVTGASASNRAYSIAIDSTYMYVGGYDDNNDWRIEKRLLSTGVVDSNFGTSGVVTGASASNRARTIAIDSTYMYVGGYDDNTDWRIEKRLLSDGSPDPNFGTSGVVTGATASNIAYAIAIDSTYMYVTGSDSNNIFRIEKRSLHSGSLNTYSAFTDEGLASSNTATTLKEQGQSFRLRMLINATSTTSTVDTLSFKLQVAPKGVASTCANVSTSTYSDVSMTTGTIRFYDNPTLYDNYQLVTSSTDPTYQAVGNFAQSYKEQNPFRNDHGAISFGGNGIWDFALYDHSMPRETTYCFRAIHEDGYELNTYSYYPEITSYTPYLTQSGYRVFREDVDGVDFGTSGVVTGASTSTQARSIVIDSTYMYVAGYDNNTDFRIEKRLLSTGVVDSNFGTAGVVTGDSASSIARSIAIDSTYMYIAGYEGNNPYDWRIEKRLLSTGAVDSNFGTSGVVTSASTSRFADGIAIDSTYMYVAGRDDNTKWRIEKRLLSTGALDSNFGTSGVVTGDSASSVAYSIAIDSTYMYVVGFQGSFPRDWRIEKRLLSTGALDSNFGASGVVTGDSASSVAYSIVIDSTYMYVAGNDDNSDFRIEKRLLSDGSFDSNFGTSGVVTGASSSTEAYSIVIDSTYMYVGGYDDNNDWRIEKRLLSTGALDSNFGASGVVTGDSASDSANSIAIDSTYMYVAGNDDNSDWRIEKRLLSSGATSTQNIVPGAPFAAQNNAATLTNTTQHFHLRTLVSVTSSTLPLSDQDFKLQVALKGASPTCADVSSGNYADVATSTGDIRYHDNTNFTHNTVLGTTSTDPYITSVTSTINQTYLEQNNFTNANASVPYGYHAMWDFSLADVTAPDSTTYCFRIVRSDNSLLESYTQFPEVTTVASGANVPPTITSFSDAPDPVTVGNAVTFTVDWNDVNEDDTRTFVCKSDSFTTSTLTCPGGWWASSTAFSATDPIQVSYTALVGDIGTNNYYVFVCDTSNACSNSTTSDFTVAQANNDPYINSVIDEPDPVVAGSQITFTVNWTDPQSDNTRSFICKSNSFTTSTLTCPGGWWASSTSFAATNPVQMTYTTEVSNEGVNNYYAFVCDVDSNCSSGTFGTFLVNLTDAVTGFIEGLFNIMGDVIFR